MLEKDGVGERSGVSPLVVLVRSQKKRKVRVSTVSRNAAAWAGSRGTGGGGGPSEWLTPHAARIAAARAAASCVLRVMQGEYRSSPLARPTGAMPRWPALGQVLEAVPG